MDLNITMDQDHIYRVNRKIVPGVSSLLMEVGLIDENVIRFADPSLGSAVHKACELDDNGVLDFDSCQPDVHARLDQWRRFMNDGEFEVYANEKSLYSKLGFCGTPDRILAIPGKGYFLADIKTSNVRSISTKVQLAFYKRLVEEEIGTQLQKVMEVVLDGKSKVPQVIVYDDLTKEESIMRSILNIHYYKKGKS